MQQNRQDKIKTIKYTHLEMQQYLADGDRNIEVLKAIFKARGKMLDLKVRWKYTDKFCSPGKTG